MRFIKAWIYANLALFTSALTIAGVSKRYDPVNLVGYLGVFFLGNAPNVYFYTSTNADPIGFTALNGGSPVIVPTLGTKGVRDPSIITGVGADTGKYWIIGTDLDISQTTWAASVRTGSRGILVWESTDLIHWTNERLPIVEDETAGMVWAPDAIWDADAGKYLVHWSSKFYSASDVNHTGTHTVDMIRYAHTSDFITFTAPQTYFDGGGIIDLNILPLSNNGFARFYKNETAALVYQQTSYDGLFGTWVDTHPVISSNTEGPAAFWDNAVNARAHLLLDYFGSGAGYKPYRTAYVEGGVWAAENNTTPVGLRHGSVMSLTSHQWVALDTAY